MRAATVRALALVAWAAVPGVALAYDTPKILSLGGAGLALGLGNDALYGNPAGIALGNFYSIQLAYFDDFEGNDRQVSASITDGFEKSLTGGIGYIYRDRQKTRGPDLESTVHRFDAALAFQVAPGFALGASARLLIANDDVGGVDVDPSGFEELTFDAGLMWRTSIGLSLAFIGTNLTDSQQTELPMGIGGGIGFAYEVLNIEVDVRHDFQAKKPNISVGASVLIGDMFAIRAGGTHDFATASSAISAGVGVANKQFGADLGFRQRISGDGAAPGLSTERLFGLSVHGMPFL